MRKKITTIFLIISLILSFGLVKAEVSQLTIDFLVSQTQDQWITMALAAAGYNNPDLSYLNSFQANSANDYSKTIIALVAAGENPYNYNGVNYVNGLESYFDGNQIGQASLVSDDFWGLMALRAAGYEANSSTIQAVKNFILGNQEQNGGWGYAPGAGSDTNDTAAAIMALLDTGLTATSSAIQNALTYLRGAQNNDGGFPFIPGGESDSASDSWVICALTKAGISAQTWQVSGNSPLNHLTTLYQSNGSYHWTTLTPGAVALMTAYAAVALSDSYYPIDYYEPLQNPALHYLRIEGSSGTFCDAEVEATTAMDIVVNGALICGYQYVIEQTSFGPYLTTINGETASGTFGWLYRVNWLSPQVGAAQYQLEVGDEVLWYYGEWGNQPLKISLSESQVEPGEEVTTTVEYFNETAWLPVNGATVYAGNQTYQTNVSGQTSFSFQENGNYEIYAEKQNFVRSPRLDLVVGRGFSQRVNMVVNIESPTGPGGSNISFIINPDTLNFGTLQPGQSASTSVRVTNNGNSAFYLEAVISGDSLFEDNTYLDNQLWENYSDNYNVDQSKDINVRLEVLGNFTGRGQRQGNLIFWATSL